SRRTPRRSSSRWTWALTADFEIFSRLAAAEKLPLSTTRAKAAMPSSGSIGQIVPKSGQIVHEIPSNRRAAPGSCAAEQRMEATMDSKPFVCAPGAGSTLNVLGVTHLYKATAEETGGAFSLWEAIVPPGTGAPPHRHDHEDESFYVLSGELVVEV